MPGAGDTWVLGTGGRLQLSITLPRADPEGALSPLVLTACARTAGGSARGSVPFRVHAGQGRHCHTFDGRSFSSILVQVR